MSDSSKPATIGERIGGALASATDEMRASAKPESKKAATQAARTSGG